MIRVRELTAVNFGKRRSASRPPYSPSPIRSGGLSFPLGDLLLCPSTPDVRWVEGLGAPSIDFNFSIAHNSFPWHARLLS